MRLKLEAKEKEGRKTFLSSCLELPVSVYAVYVCVCVCVTRSYPRGGPGCATQPVFVSKLSMITFL